MLDPIDLRAWRAERRQAAGRPIIVDDGEPIICDPIDLWPIERSDDMAFFAAILGGEEARDRFLAAGGNFAAINRVAFGTDSPGESQDSSASSETSDSVTPSSPTSPDSTD